MNNLHNRIGILLVVFVDKVAEEARQNLTEKVKISETKSKR